MTESSENQEIRAPAKDAPTPSAPPRSHRAAVWLGLAVSAGILAWLALHLDWPAFLREFRKVRVVPVVGVVFLLYLSYWIRALRWRHLLPGHTVLSRRRLFDATVVGFTANLVLPLRAGEIVRPWILARWQPVRFATGFASVVVERIFDSFVLVALLGLSISRLPETPPWVRSGAIVLASMAFAILVLMVYAYFHSGHIVSLAEWFLGATVAKIKPALAGKLLHMAREFTEGLRGISNAKELALVLFWSVVLWLEMSLLYQVGLLAFGVGTSDLWIGAATATAIITLTATPIHKSEAPTPKARRPT